MIHDVKLKEVAIKCILINPSALRGGISGHPNGVYYSLRKGTTEGTTDTPSESIYPCYSLDANIRE